MGRKAQIDHPQPFQGRIRQAGFTYTACGPFTKHYEEIQKFREIGNLKHLYRDELYKALFAHNAA